MRFLKAAREFFISIGRSCYDVGYYRVVRERGWQRSLGYYAVFSVVAMLIMTVPILYDFNGVAMKARNEAMSRVPDGTAFEVKDGRLAVSGIEQPWEMTEDDFLVVIDDSIVGTVFPERLEQYKGGVFMTNEGVFFKDENGRRQIQFWKDFGDFGISKTQVADWLDRWWAWLMTLAAGVIMIGVYLGLFVGGLTFVLLASLLIFVLGRISKRQEHFADWVTIGFHAVTLPTLVDGLLGLVDFQIPYAFSVLFAMVTIAVMMDQRQMTPVSGEEPKVQ